MKRLLNKKTNTVAIYFVLIMVLEIILKIQIVGKLSLSSILYTFIFSLPVIMILSYLTNFFNKKVSKIIFYISVILLTLYFEFQYVFFKLFSVTFSFNTIGLANQAADFTNIIVEAIGNYFLGIFVLLLPLILIIVFHKNIEFHRLNVPVKKLGILVIAIFIGLTYLSLLPNKDALYSPYNLYFNLNAQEKNIDKFGLITATRIDLKRVIFGFDEKIIAGKMGGADISGNKTKEVTYNVTDINFDELKSSTSNKSLNSLYDYFANSNPTNQNEYTGYFKGKNLIFILAEGFNEIAVSEELTPTLYKLINNGFNFTNYYSPVFLSTTGGEFQATTGLIPTQEILKDWKSSMPTISYALGNSFSKIGYRTQAYHDWTYSYYNRDKTMKTLGFNTYLGCKNGLEKEMNCSWLPSDVDLINVTTPKYINEDGNFMTYYVSVSGHAPYFMTSGNSIAYKNRELVKDLPYSSKVKAYIATQIEFDRAIEQLIKNLEEAGKLDDTVLVITGDHYPYTLTNSEVNEASKYTKDDIVEVNHSNLIIWNNKMEKPVKVDKVGSQIDVLPTVLNLFGIEYDSRLIIGKDILSDYPGLATFSNRSWVSDEGTYFSSGKKFVPKDGKTVSDDYVNNMNVEVANRFTISGLIIKNNAYKKILGD